MKKVLFLLVFCIGLFSTTYANPSIESDKGDITKVEVIQDFESVDTVLAVISNDLSLDQNTEIIISDLTQKYDLQPQANFNETILKSHYMLEGVKRVNIDNTYNILIQNYNRRCTEAFTNYNLAVQFPFYVENFNKNSHKAFLDERICLSEA